MIIRTVLTGLLGLAISIGNMYLGVETLRIIDKEYLARAASIGNALGSAIVPVTAFVVSIALRFVGVAVVFVGTAIIAAAFCGILYCQSGLDEEASVENSDKTEAA